MSELLHGPVPKWEPSPQDIKTTERLLASDDELDQAYGEAYSHRLWVKEYAGEDSKSGITAVGELDNLAIAEFRLEQDIDIDALSMGDCLNLLAYPGRGETRAERVRDGIKQVLGARNNPQN